MKPKVLRNKILDKSFFKRILSFFNSFLLLKKIIILTFLLISQNFLFGQNVGITDDNLYTPNSTAILDVKSTNKGMLVPRLSKTQRTSIVNPAEGLLVYDSDEKSFYYFSGTQWLNLSADNSNHVWKKSDNQVYTTESNYKLGIGTTNSNSKLEVKADATANSSDTLFVIKDKTGRPVFIVTQNGAQLIVDESATSNAAGFTVSGRNTSQILNDYLVISPDSVRIYIKKNTSKKNLGGFAVSGRTTGKTTAVNEYLTVNTDSTRIYTTDTLKGFGIGNIKSGISENYMQLTPNNYLIGQEAGKNLSTGKYNSFIGYKSGYSSTTGSKNYFIGFSAGLNNTIGNNNIFIGENTGYNNINGNSNTFIGINSGYTNGSGFSNLFIGAGAGYYNTSGNCNIFLGNDAGGSNTTARYNTFIGNGAGYSNTTSEYNTYIGINSGYQITNGRDNTCIGLNSGYRFDRGSRNTFIGSDAGRGGGDADPVSPYNCNDNIFIGYKSCDSIYNGSNNVFIGNYTGSYSKNCSGNIFIGHEAGKYETTSNKLCIANSASSAPLLYGCLQTGRIGIGTTTLTKQLNVAGDASVTGDVSAASITASSMNINGMSMGKIYLTANGNIVSVDGGKKTLYWNYSSGKIQIINTSGDYVDYWYKAQKGATSESNSGAASYVNGTYDIIDITGIQNSYGYEIHFGQADGTTGWCSVWLQFANNKLVGHYIKY